MTDTLAIKTVACVQECPGGHRASQNFLSKLAIISTKGIASTEQTVDISLGHQSLIATLPTSLAATRRADSRQGSLEKVEMEIAELLRSRRGMPVSIASLPMLYYEKYGRHLQAEGYLNESQRHGKAGFSLTKLLALLKNSIRLVDRPHGQHSVILAEDAPSQYGPVRDVRIPSQEKRMFGFVSFMYAETVSMILMKRNPHYICGACVLVKPYRGKSKSFDSRYHMEKYKPPVYYPSQYPEMDPELHSMTVESESSMFLKKHMMEEQERRHFSELNLAQIPVHQQSYFNYEDFELPEGYKESPLDDHFNYTLDVMNSGLMTDVAYKQQLQ